MLCGVAVNSCFVQAKRYVLVFLFRRCVSILFVACPVVASRAVVGSSVSADGAVVLVAAAVVSC